LDAVQDSFFAAIALGRAFRVNNTSPCRHPVHCTRMNLLNAADTIAMQ
jgi:hypothetical protein